MLSPKTNTNGNSDQSRLQLALATQLVPEPPEACTNSPPSLLSMEDANGENFGSDRSLPGEMGHLQPSHSITGTGSLAFGSLPLP
ncbi:unnamed protein product [Cylicostephanus goldi]|uniref:Uncharacterized protein n=1 Tax=Cylicostephanus goldi TaxID=71465 RepID=A0A3P6QSR9_CYLGO|nr:unnamed protein product [Cylicostephanus goldi]